jgi:S-DNA-T family DNA segregation ATPase FtsK/SpoIIIE
MVARVRLTPKEKGQISRIMKEGWDRDLEWWTIARIALTRSLQIAEAPDPETYATVAARPGGAELHSPQLTGEGKGEQEDFTDVYRGLLSIYEGRDLFQDEDAFHESLQRHVRRGIAVIAADLSNGADINRYIVDELFAERTGADSVDIDSAALGERVTKVLGQIGVGAKLLSSFEGPRLTRFTFELGLLDDLDRLRRGTSKIAFALGLGDAAVSVALGSSARTVILDIPRPSSAWRTVGWPELATGLSSPKAMAMGLPICVGTDVLGEPFLLDLAEAPHLFVGGTTGSGKSMCLHTILLSLLMHHEQRPHLLLIDPKAVEFAGYRELPNLISDGTVVTPDAALQALEGLVETMDDRRDVLERFKARDINEANANGAKLPRIVAVVDELGDLLMTRPEVDIPLIRLAQKARSVGIHLVLATQRPEAATFPGMLRSNVPSRIALTVQKASESRIILDAGGAEDLLGKGDMLIKFAGQPIVRVHGGRVTPADIIAAVR